MMDEQIVSVSAVQCQFWFAFNYMKSHFFCIFGDFLAIGIDEYIIKYLCGFYVLANVFVKFFAIQNSEIFARYSLRICFYRNKTRCFH